MTSLDIPLSKGASLLRLKEKVEHRRWLTNILFDDVWKSLNHTGPLESEVQFCFDENPEVGEFENMPQCPFFSEFLRYCPSPLFKPPLVRTPKTFEIATGLYLGRVTYNKLMLSIESAFMIPPCFHRKTYNNHQSIPSLDFKKKQILCLSVALVHSQERFIGSFNESCFVGLDFISLVANSYGVKLAFYDPGKSGAPVQPIALAPLRKEKRFIKKTDAAPKERTNDQS